MSWIIIILILIVVGVILLPGLILAFKVYSLKRKFTKQYQDFINTQQGSGSSDNNDYSDRHEKIFDESMGEYIEFEEIPDDENSTEEFKSENIPFPSADSQVEEAEWEDI